MSYLRSAASRTKQSAPRSIRVMRPQKKMGDPRHIRYAVVGLGYIAQVAVLPAFRHASRNSRLVALFSDDPAKLRALKRKYRVPLAGSYADYEAFLRREMIDAVYIATPNSLHSKFAIAAARAGVHVLCEKPLGTTGQECRRIIEACRQNRVKLMTAYRLHFEKSNLEAMRIARSGKIGEPRYFNSIFSMQVSSPNIRLEKKMGGGPLYDLGVYCINAARYIFREEPTEVLAMTARGDHKRFREVEEMAGAIMRFPGERLASFTCSFGAADAATYQVAGTTGVLGLKNAYEYALPVEMEITINGEKQVRKFPKRDQFGAELVYFSDCILRNREPEPSGMEGLMDVLIIEALYRSARTSRPVKLPNLRKGKRPSLNQAINCPPVRKPELIHAKPAARE